MLTLLFVLMSASGHADDRVATPEADQRSPPVTQTLRHLEASSQLCPAQKSFFETGFKKRMSLGAFANKIAAAKPQVIFLGDDHNRELGPQYARLFRSLRTSYPRVNCVAMELSRVPDFWRPLADEAKRAGVPVILTEVECPKMNEVAPKEGLQVFADNFNDRNACMAMRLEGMIKSGRCQSVLMMNGGRHLQDEPETGRPSLPHRLKEKGFTTYSAIVLSAWRKDPGIKSPLIWRSATQDARGDSAPLCQQTADYDVRENMAFETAGNVTAARVPMFRTKDQAPAREGTWSDFDAVMWLRCPNEHADTCNPATVLPAPKVTDRLETMIQDVSRRRSKAR